MDLLKIKKIKLLALEALITDDELLEALTLKGGNAIDLIYNVSSRASMDLDFSLCADFESPEKTKGKIRKTLEKTFTKNGYHLFDYKFEAKPPIDKKDDVMPFWGGYTVEFKIIEAELFAALKDNPEKLSLSSTVVGPDQKRKFSIDISKYEYCEFRKEFRLSGLSLYVYTPEMLLYEKLRALCQQTHEYRKLMEGGRPKPRSADFVDIYIIMQQLKPDIYKTENIEICKRMFDVKRVDLNLLLKIPDYKELHFQGFDQVEATVLPSQKLERFEFYFDYVVKIAKILLDKTTSSD